MSNDDANNGPPQNDSKQKKGGAPDGWAKLTLERKELWKSRLEEEVTLLEWAVPALSVVVEYVSVSHCGSKIKRKWLKDNFMDVYALAWAVLLTAMLLISASPAAKGWLKWVVGIFAAIRIFDILKYRVYYLLVKGHKDVSKNNSHIRRRFVFALLNFYEVVVAYAILYFISGDIVRECIPLESSVAAFYYSLVTMVTLGYGDYVPKHDYSRALVISQLASSLVFLLFIIPALISLFAGQRETPKGETQG
jgi:hypothetical protein